MREGPSSLFVKRRSQRDERRSFCCLSVVFRRGAKTADGQRWRVLVKKIWRSAQQGCVCFGFAFSRSCSLFRSLSIWLL